MPARLSRLVAWLERQGLTVEKPGSGSHWKVRFEDGSVFTIPAHNALRSEVSDIYLRKVAARLGVAFKDLLRELS